ncbi:MAG TPA: hypothetical protein VE978_14445 [Chitinophagales bacterium]|nr:hypothetical protein [Chitinophagales bacterium]
MAGFGSPPAIAVLFLWAIVYILSIVIITGAAILISKYFFKRLLSFSKIFESGLVWWFVGVAFSFLISKIFIPTDVIYGEPSYDKKLELSERVVTICLYFPIVPIMISLALAIKKQIISKSPSK